MKDEATKATCPARRCAGGVVAALILAILAGPVTTLHADAIWLDKPSGAPIFANTKIVRVDKLNLVFIIAGNETTRELSRVARIAVDDEPALNAAEEAYAAGQWDAAVDGYERVVRSTAKPWLAEWARARLVDASAKSGRFDSAVNAYIALVLKDPAAAAQSKPAMPAAGSAYLDTAVQQVNQALSGVRLTDPQRTALLAFLIDLHTARKDESAANAAAARLDEVLARDPNNPAAAKANARRRLQSASAALSAGRYDAVVAEVDADPSIFAEPAQQAEALYLLAEARYGQARESKSINDLKDAALSYMRLVAQFRESENKPFVAESLLRTAAICEALGERESALRLYDEVLRDHPASPAAAMARQSADRLRPAR